MILGNVLSSPNRKIPTQIRKYMLKKTFKGRNFKTNQCLINIVVIIETLGIIILNQNSMISISHLNPIRTKSLTLTNSTEQLLSWTKLATLKR